MQIRVSMDRGALEGLRRLGDGMGEAMESGCQRTILWTSGEIKRGILSGAGGLRNRSGALGKSWVFKRWGGSDSDEEADARSERSATGAKASLASNLIYARIHNETETTVTPKGHPYLAIPLAAAKTAAGVSRWGSPRDCPDKLTLIRSKSGNMLLVKILAKVRERKEKITISVDGDRKARSINVKTGIMDTFIPYYVLKEKVTIRGTHYVDKAVEATERTASAHFDDAIAAAIKRAGMVAG